MTYEQRPNEGTLWENRYKTSDRHPDKKGTLLITRELLMQLVDQQGKGDSYLVEISAWERETREGKPIINLKIEKPYKFP